MVMQKPSKSMVIAPILMIFARYDRLISINLQAKSSKHTKLAYRHSYIKSVVVYSKKERATKTKVHNHAKIGKSLNVTPSRFDLGILEVQPLAELIFATS